MSDSRTATFIDALHTLERDGDLEPIGGLFADEAEIGNVTLGRSFKAATAPGCSGRPTGIPSGGSRRSSPT